MKIAIIGTRGIPNNYGGFEQLAQYLSVGLHAKGHEIFVYSSHRHVYQEKVWKEISIIHKYDPENKMGTAGQFVYDLNCIMDSRKRSYDAIINLGYTSSAIWMYLFPKVSVVITNMDGLEWKRSKFSKKVQQFLMYSEKLAVKYSHHLVADSTAIQSYLDKKYNIRSSFIAYGAPVFDSPDEEVIRKFNISKQGYNMLIARMEPENNIEMILEGVRISALKKPFLVVGNTGNKYGTFLKAKYEGEKNIIFTGPIYVEKIINNLRYFSSLYFHGHSVGGTNPSLLEAMGCQSLVAAHNNEFNRSVLGDDAFYFENADQVSRILEADHSTSANRKIFVENNCNKIRTEYSWDKIVDGYEKVILSTLKK